MWIYNSFGFKTWRIGNQDLTVGGHITFQTGTPWARSEGAGISAQKTCAPGARPAGLRTCPPITPSDPTTDARPGTANGGVGVRLHPFGAEGRRTSDEYTINLSGAWGFPWAIGKCVANSGSRCSTRPTSSAAGAGTVRARSYPVRRYYQRPRQMRASIKFRF